uniref:CSON010011 protein n=1 Tax=Culicoides sonorensis TaxID=179676 RepID=A0A336MYG5_CULSO
MKKNLISSKRKDLELILCITIKDCTSSDMDRNLTGSDILHKHSINSLLEQNGEIINRGLASPNEGRVHQKNHNK